MYLYRAVDKAGNTVDFLLTKRRNKRAAHLFLLKAINNNGKPVTINIDKSGANKAVTKTYNKRTCSKIKIGQCKYLNNRVEAGHRIIKWRVQNMLGSKGFESASRILTGMEIVQIIKKQLVVVSMATANSTFCSLLAQITPS